MSTNADDLLDERTLGRIKWRCRRGMLENDLLLERFFERHQQQLTQRHANTLLQLMDLSDNDLLDLLLARKPLADSLDTPDMQEILRMLRPPHRDFAA